MLRVYISAKVKVKQFISSRRIVKPYEKLTVPVAPWDETKKLQAGSSRNADKHLRSLDEVIIIERVDARNVYLERRRLLEDKQRLVVIS